MSLCECGCGQAVPLAKQTKRSVGHVKGEPMRFVAGHQTRGRRGEDAAGWKGGRHVDQHGYVKAFAPGHPRADSGGHVFEHILVAEAALGHPLTPPAEVHHVDENKANNAPSNLVICPDGAYHALLHQRMRALEACGNPSWRKCSYCKEYDDPERMRPRSNGTFYHRDCVNAYMREKHRKSSFLNGES